MKHIMGILFAASIAFAGSIELPLADYTWQAENKAVQITPGASVKVTADVSTSSAKEVPILAIARPKVPIDMSMYDEIVIDLNVKSGAYMRFSVICIEAKTGAKFLYEVMPKQKTGELSIRIPFSKFFLPPWGIGKKQAGDTVFDRTAVSAVYIGGVLGKPDVTEFQIQKVSLNTAEK